MADEITINTSLNINAVNLVEKWAPGSISIDLTSTAGAGGSQVIGTSYEVIVKGDTAAGGCYFVRNTDPTNYVEIGREVSSAFYGFLKLLPGETSVGRLSTADIFAKANTAPVNLQYRILSP